jgi:integrase
MYTASEAKERFLESLPENQRSVASTILQVVAFDEKRKRRSINEFDKSEFIALLNRCLEDGYSKYTFDSRKGLITSYLNFLLENEFRTDGALSAMKDISYDDLSLSSVVEKRLFRDYETLLYFVDWALDEIMKKTESSEEAYATPVCLLLSAWEGIDIDEVVQIKKEHIDDIGGRIWLPISQRFIYPEKETLQRLIAYRDETHYIVSSRAHKTYSTGEYLFRSYLTPQISQDKVRSIINGFNKKSPERVRKTFSYEKVRLSGIYARAHAKETEEHNAENLIKTPTISRVEVLSEFFDTKFKALKEATDFTRSYLQWKKFYYN